MKNLFLLVIVFPLFLTTILAQPSSAVVDFQSTSEGILIPRMTTDQKNNISTPVRSLLVYDLDTKSYWYYEDNVWKEIAINSATSQEVSNDASQFFEYELLDDLQISIPGTFDEVTQITVCLDITHSEVGYLEIGIIHDGKVIPLSYSNGGNGDNFTQTCFSNAATTPISSISEAGAPFTGQYLPDGSFNDLIGSPLAGSWTLFIYVTEEFAWNGYLNSWSIVIDSGEPNYASVLADGNRDTKIQVEESPNENKIRFDIAGQEKMIIDQNGQVGIGTTTPGAPLSIVDPSYSAVQLQTGNFLSGFQQTMNGGALFLNFSNGEYGAVLSSSGDSYLKGGNFGLGTSQPIGKLHVEDGNIIVNSPSFNSELFLRNSNSSLTGRGISGTKIKHHALGGLGFFPVSNNVQSSEAILNLTESYIEARVNSPNHALKVRNGSSFTGTSGIEVELNVPGLSPGNNFMTFTHYGKVRGKIHGQETLTTLSRDLINDLLGDSPVANDQTTASNDRDQGAIAGNDDAFFNFIGTNYGQELCWHTMEFVEAIIVLIANSFSFLDPDDLLGAYYEVISRGIKLWAFITIEELTAGIAYESEGADYAEWLPKADTSEILNPGDVVGVIGGKISKQYQEADKFMVISHQPMVVGNMPGESKVNGYEKIAFIGQVPVKVIGKVNIGEYILPSGNGDGYAIAVANQEMKALDYQRIIGIAWSKGDSTKRVNLINTAVGINSNDMASVINQMQSMMNSMQMALKRLDPQFEMALYDVQGQTSVETFQKEYTSSPTLNEMIQHDLGDYLSQQQVTVDERRQMVFASIKDELLTQGFDFGYFPFLEEMLANPEKENIEKAKSHYDQVFNRMNSLLSSIGK